MHPHAYMHSIALGPCVTVVTMNKNVPLNDVDCSTHSRRSFTSKRRSRGAGVSKTVQFLDDETETMAIIKIPLVDDGDRDLVWYTVLALSHPIITDGCVMATQVSANSSRFSRAR